MTESQAEKAYISDEHRRVLREVDADLRAAVGGAVSTVRVAAGDWTTVESYVERIVMSRDDFWRAHLAACDPWKEPCDWCGRAPSESPSSPGIQPDEQP